MTQALPEGVLERCQLQDDASKRELLRAHRAAIDAGDPSYLLGLASFAEGLDLPGGLLPARHHRQAAFRRARQPGGRGADGAAGERRPQPVL